MVPSERTVTVGVGHGKKAARQIDAWLGSDRGARRRSTSWRGSTSSTSGTSATRPSPAAELPIAERWPASARSSAVFTREAQYEAGRCLSCGNCFECDGCLGACPEDAVIKLGVGHRYRFDYDRCTGCGACFDQCPVHAIEMTAEELRCGDARRQRGGGVGRLPAERGVLHLPDHAVLADGRARRRVVEPGPANVWGSVPGVVEMQSEGGAAGALHGALQSGALATTFTASQGLLLMIPNMYKIAGELTPAVLHVAARSLAAQGLSIFGDHSDVMAVRQTGFAMLASASVQEAHDLALVAQAATLRTRVPFVHFFDGFRTSHELNTIELLSDDDLRALVPEELVRAHRSRALSPERPFIRGTAQNPDVYFQARETVNPFYARVPDVVEETMARSRSAAAADTTSSTTAAIPRPSASSSSWDRAARPSARRWLAERDAVSASAWCRCGCTGHFPRALCSTRFRRPCAIAVLDRTKEPGSIGEPLFLDTVAALADSCADGERCDATGHRRSLRVVVEGVHAGHGRRRLRGAQCAAATTPVHGRHPRRRLGNEPRLRRGARHRAVRHRARDLLRPGLRRDCRCEQEHDQDPRRRGGNVRAGLLRLRLEEVRVANRLAPPLRAAADPRPTSCSRRGSSAATSSGCSTGSMSSDARPTGRRSCSTRPPRPEEVWDALSRPTQEQILAKHIELYVIDAGRIAREVGLAGRINVVLQTCFFALSGVLPREQAIDRIKAAIAKSYGRRGAEVVERNQAAVDRSLEALHRVELPARVRPAVSRRRRPGACARVRPRGDGGDDGRPGRRPAGQRTPGRRHLPERDGGLREAQHLRSGCGLGSRALHPMRQLQLRLPAQRDPLGYLRRAALEGAPEGFASAPLNAVGLPDTLYTLQVYVEDCTGCALCVEACPVLAPGDSGRGAINLAPREPLVAEARESIAFFESLPAADRSRVDFGTVRGTQFLEPLFEFSGACAGCGETPYMKLLSQLFGDRLMVANATGCSSIYGGNLPTTPWTTDADGRGPAWSNSLFEDNAEFGLGFRLAADRHADLALRRLAELRDAIGAELVDEISPAPQLRESELRAQRERVAELKRRLERLDGAAVRDLLSVVDHLVRRSVWIVGGDGWAYDIGAGGLDHVLASGRNVNVLVLDTEVYSNTGGPDVEGDPARRGRQVRRGRKDRAQKGHRIAGDRLRERLRRPGRNGCRPPADAQRVPGGRGLRRPVAHPRLQPLHRSRDRDARRARPTAPCRRERLLAAHPLRPDARRSWE